MRSLPIALTLVLSISGVASAQTATTATKTTTASSAGHAQAEKPRTAASLQCSKDADAKNIHGKPRKAFMSSCKKAAK